MLTYAIIVTLALVASVVANIRAYGASIPLDPSIKSVPETFDMLRDAGKISEEEANLAKLQYREARRIARKAK